MHSQNPILNDAIEAELNRAQAIVDRAVKSGSKLTADQRREVEAIIEKVQDAKDNELLREEVQRMTASFNAPSIKGFADVILDAGWNLKANPSVVVPAYRALQKTLTLPGATVISPSEPGITANGRDTRYLRPSLPRENAEGQTAISDFRQTARTVTGTVERAITATTDKAELNVTLTHVVEAVKQWAVTVSDIPNAVLEDMRNFRQFLDGEGRFQVEKAIDDHVIAQIVAATPPFGNTGTGLVAQIRNAVTSMRAEGANPTLMVLNAADAASLDLTADAGGYVFPLRDTGASPLWGLRVIERAGTTPPYVIDPNMLGTLYLAGMRFDVDPYTGFKKHLSTLRVETHGLMFVRDARGARRVAAT